jgi:subfamily B ATP-binding cassette protein MsbA
MLLIVNWKVTLITVSLGGVVLYLIRNVTSNYSLRFGKDRLDIDQGISSIAAESLSGIREIKMLAQEESYSSALMGKLKKFTEVQTRFSVFSNLPNYLLEFVVILLIAVAVSYVQLSSSLSTKALLPLLGFFVLVGQRLFRNMSMVLTQRMKFIASIPSLKLTHSLIYKKVPQEHLDRGEPFEKLDSDIVFKDVSFAYDGSRHVLRNFNMTISNNKMTALIGPSGSGKSTIADLLMRLLNPQSGSVEVNNRDIQYFSLSSWRGRIAYVSQDPFLFNMTIRENILLGKPKGTEREVLSAAKIANIHDFIKTLPRGYDTLVGDRGVKLSGGQRQRIVIARAVIRDPELFIFDEATSALDSEAEAAVQKSIEELSKKKTILIIAHRPSTIKNADRVLDLSELVQVQISEDLNEYASNN